MSLMIGCCLEKKKESEKVLYKDLQEETTPMAKEKEDLDDGDESAVNEPVELDLQSYFHGKSGCAVFYDTKMKKTYIYKIEKTKQQSSPCSTFKIVTALGGLREGVLKSTETVLGYSGKEYPVPSWNKELTLKEAFAASCVWYFRKAADQIGQEKMQEYVDKLHYGNGDLSEWQGSGVNGDSDLDGFWLESSLQISPQEQVQVLREIFENTTDYGNQIPVLKDIMKVYDNQGSIIYGKTGTGRGQDGTCDNAWFVGLEEVSDRTIYFAVHLDGAVEGQEISGPIAKELTIEILTGDAIPTEE